MSNADKRFFYETIAERFETLDNPYDISRRLVLVFDRLLRDDLLRDKLVLDAGCGYGAFSRRAAQAGARVISCDIAEKLVAKTVAHTRAAGMVADATWLGLRDASFDVVISSEMIEHTHAPARTLEQLARVLKSGGLVVLTTPNRAWEWSVHLASALHVRPFQGIENFQTWKQVETACRASGLEILVHWGFHPVPFQLRFLWGFSDWVSARFGTRAWGRVMINQAILARKK